jgi:DNA repair protein RadC
MLARESDADYYAHARLDYHATVRELPSNERPRERLEHFGAGALSLAELLAIILRTGTRSDNALELANKLLSKYGGLPGLVRADFRELCAEHGMGAAKSAQVKAALELGRRLALVQMDERYKISSPQDAANLVMMDMACLDTEQIRVLLLDTRGQLVEKVSLYQGTATSSVLRAAEVFRPAILRKCPGLILCHNHPSGDPTPPPKDRRQFHRWLIGIDEEGIFINPALLAHAEVVVAASHAYSGEASTCSSVMVRPSAHAAANACSPSWERAVVTERS